MARLNWGQLPHEYEVGVDRGVFYPPSAPGVAWNGLSEIVQSDIANDPEATYFDGEKILRRKIRTSFAGTIQAFTYPESFYENALRESRSRLFGMSYRTQHNDRYKIHLVYNVLASPSSKSYLKDDAGLFSWDFTTKAVPINGIAESAHLIIDSGIAYSWTVAALEDVLYGVDGVPARLPLPDEVMSIIDSNALLQIIDHGDGSWTAIGSDDIVSLLDSTSFQIDWPSVEILDWDTYSVYTL